MNLPPQPMVNNWMSAGSLHNWYSSYGCEIEEGWVLQQQFGMQWPAIYPHQDMQTMRGLWLGATNFTDENNSFFPYKVVTVGPRHPQFFAAYPVEFKMYSKFEPTYVQVNGIHSYDKEVMIDSIDNSMIFDRTMVNVVNTHLGITMTRKISQFSQKYNDNYIIYDYTFTNTGNVNADDEIELPNQTLTGVYFFWTYKKCY